MNFISLVVVLVTAIIFGPASDFLLQNTILLIGDSPTIEEVSKDLQTMEVGFLMRFFKRGSEENWRIDEEMGWQIIFRPDNFVFGQSGDGKMLRIVTIFKEHITLYRLNFNFSIVFKYATIGWRNWFRDGYFVDLQDQRRAVAVITEVMLEFFGSRLIERIFLLLFYPFQIGCREGDAEGIIDVKCKDASTRLMAEPVYSVEGSNKQECFLSAQYLVLTSELEAIMPSHKSCMIKKKLFKKTCLKRISEGSSKEKGFWDTKFSFLEGGTRSDVTTIFIDPLPTCQDEQRGTGFKQWHLLCHLP
ncbi:hypothetical protein MKW98_012979 [Papaver atlanticum]|uniref:Uncharacterized protein n=1 Tax=Papaver atlanticum TaxID=357466 RepID=A0AAD4XES9_9MAGN|nr:hypothetical protein MKW98_012979 [Papaver atlanticum]